MTLAFTLRRVLALALVALLATCGWPASPTRAADDSNIPGVPLPGSVVTGKLGGPVYDHVYSIDVPAAHVIVLSLSGDPGTDFDLYLFDSRATTIYQNDGVVAFSTGSTSTESITYPTQSGGRYYIDLNGATNIEGNFRLTVKLLADTTPPNVELKMDDGAPATQDSTIRVSLIATDDLAGVDDMQFSLDGEHWDDWRAYAPFTLWTFPQVDGTRTLYSRVRDAVGNVSTAVSASITIDTQAPTIVSRSPLPGAEVTALRPTFRVDFSERIDPRTWSAVGFVLQHVDGELVPGAYAYDPTGTVATFVPGADLVPGDSYVASLSGVTDLAGNVLAPVGSWVVTALLDPRPSLASDVRSAVYGQIITLRGHVATRARATITVDRSIAGGPWRSLGVATPDSNGNIAVRTMATATSRYRLHVARSVGAIEQTSAAIGVTVRRKVSLQGLSASITGRVARGATISLTGVVTPSAPATAITFTVYRYDAGRRAYVATSSAVRPTSAGRAAFSWRPTLAGSYYLRLSAPATPLLAAGVSSAYRWVVQ